LFWIIFKCDFGHLGRFLKLSTGDTLFRGVKYAQRLFGTLGANSEEITMSKCSADETPVCCCMDVGTIMDNSDCTASYSRVFTNRTDAEETLAALTARARGVESDPCQITSTFTEVDGGVRLDIDFVFACEAETLIFQLGLR
jgi:uncharacterized protein (TIGR00743 family)